MLEKKNNSLRDNHFPSTWWAISIEDIIEFLSIDVSNGLNKDQISRSRSTYGSNELKELKPKTKRELFVEGIKQPMIILLLTIFVIALIIREILGALIMIIVVIIYIFVEFINKYRSDRVMAKLRELTQPMTKVLRDGLIHEIPTSDVVVGDIVILSEGFRILSDIRLVESYSLLVNESALTGESFPVQKNAYKILKSNIPLADRVNCCYSGTMVISGEGKGIIMAVGKKSELGFIFHKIQALRKEKTEVQNSMIRLAKLLAIFAIIVSLLIPIVGFLRGLALQDMIFVWLALTFLMIPGQPPIIITMSLAQASFSMAHKNVVVKRLRGVETLGQISTIITDKTGTITENIMKVERFIMSDGTIINPFDMDQKIKDQLNLCLPLYSNDPTDLAIVDTLGERKDGEPYISMSGFTNNQPWRSLLYKKDNYYYTAIAGQPEILINHANLPGEEKENLLSMLLNETKKRKRVVAFAFKQEQQSPSSESKLGELTFLTLVVLIDPVRQGVKEAINKISGAGISTYLVTGDHAITAKSVADTIGINGEVLNGNEIEELDDDSLIQLLPTVKILARITPFQKERIVSLLKKRGEIVAVIGDGVNDAPALKSADVGIVMGEIGTDVAIEAADLLLTDDNFIHLPEAITISRKSLENFQKGLIYYLTAKSILLSLFLIPLFLGIPFPFAPIQIIMIELLMDLASSTIFVTESPEPDLLTHPPKKLESFLNKTIIAPIFKKGFFLALGLIIIYVWIYYTSGNIILARSSVLVAWFLGHILLALNLKQEKLPLIKQGLFSNRFGFFWLVGMIVLSILITIIPGINNILETTNISILIWIFIIIIVTCSTFWIELYKNLRLKLSKTSNSI